MRKFAALLLLILTSTVFAQAQSAEDIKLCDDSSNPDQSVIHCTAEIESGQVSAENLPIVYYNRGLAYLNKNDFDRAITDLTRSIALRPSDRLAYRLRGTAYFDKHDDEHALQDFGEAIRLRPDDSIAFAYSGYVMANRGEWDAAIKNYNQALHIDSANSDSGNPDSARTHRHANLLSNRCNAYNQKGDYDLAIQDCTESIRLDPKGSLALVRRGNAYSSKGDQDKAIQDYAQAIQLEPDGALVYLNRGVAFTRKGELDRAVQDYDHAIRLNPTYVMAYNNRGRVYAEMGNSAQAIQDFSEGIRLQPSYSVLIERGHVYLEVNDYAHALEDANRALELNPKRTEALFFRRWVFTRKGDYVRAIQDLDQAALVNSKASPNLFKAHGQANFYLGRFAAAQADFSRAIELNPEIYSALFLYLAQSRNGQDARTELEKNVATLDLKAWPGPIAELYLGHSTASSTLSAADDADEKKNREQHCEAYFYLGEHALIAGKAHKARKLFEQSIHTGVKTFVEYAASQTELNRLPHRSIWRRILRLGNAHHSPVSTSVTAARMNSSG